MCVSECVHIFKGLSVCDGGGQSSRGCACVRARTSAFNRIAPCVGTYFFLYASLIRTHADINLVSVQVARLVQHKNWKQQQTDKKPSYLDLSLLVVQLC